MRQRRRRPDRGVLGSYCGVCLIQLRGGAVGYCCCAVTSKTWSWDRFPAHRPLSCGFTHPLKETHFFFIQASDVRDYQSEGGQGRWGKARENNKIAPCKSERFVRQENLMFEKSNFLLGSLSGTGPKSSELGSCRWPFDRRSLGHMVTVGAGHVDAGVKISAVGKHIDIELIPNVCSILLSPRNNGIRTEIEIAIV